MFNTAAKRGTLVECVVVRVKLVIRQLSIHDGVVYLAHPKAVSCFQDLLPGRMFFAIFSANNSNEVYMG